MRRRTSCVLFLHIVVVALGVRMAPAELRQTVVMNGSELDAGYHLLYELKFEEARAQFAIWQASHPQDPLASASDAAAYLFQECYRQGVLTSEFFLDDKRFLGKIATKPDPEIRRQFFAAELRAQELARLQLETNPENADALFVMTLSLGMQAQYASLIEKHQLESLNISARRTSLRGNYWPSTRTPPMPT